MKKILFTAGICVLVGVLSAVAVVFLSQDKEKAPGELGGITWNNYTNSISRVATASSTILSANTARQYAKCYRDDNVSRGMRVDVSFGTTASKNWGFPVYGSASFEILPNNLGEVYAGAVTGRMETETGSTSAGYGRFRCIEGTL